MTHYKYIGKKPRLIGHCALGEWRRGNFYVQVDDLKHRWSHRWHLSNSADWECDREVWVVDNPEFISTMPAALWLPSQDDSIRVDQPAMVGQLHGETIMVHYAPGQREMAERALTNIGAKEVSPYCPRCSLLSIIVDGHWACCGGQA